MEPSIASEAPEHRFRALFDEVYLDLLRFVRRRAHPAYAEDVVGEVMLVAWRRLDDVPTDRSAARAWLFGVAHKTLQSTRRREGRQTAIAVRLAEVGPVREQADHASDATLDRMALAGAWHRLSAVHQEALALAVLDGLTSPEAAAVLDISPTAFRLRLSRARRALRRHLEARPPDGPHPDELAPAGRPR